MDTPAALVTNIQRYSLEDGPGVRTTVFLKGCPLRCLWCHNPECLSAKPELSFQASSCIGCGKCLEVCPSKAHSLQDGIHTIDRSLCIQCGKCVEACPAGALSITGKAYTAEALEKILLKDRSLYARSGGGITFSGGEPLLQKDFLLSIMSRLKAQGIDIAVDTCGEVPRETLEAVEPYVSLFLYDLKCIDSALHQTLTGRPNERILENLEYLLSNNAPVRIRMPLIHPLNDSLELMKRTVEWLASYKDCFSIDLLSYHKMGMAKYAMTSKTIPRQDLEAPDHTAMEEILSIFRSAGIKADWQKQF